MVTSRIEHSAPASTADNCIHYVRSSKFHFSTQSNQQLRLFGSSEAYSDSVRKEGDTSEKNGARNLRRVDANLLATPGTKKPSSTENSSPLLATQSLK